MSSYIRLPIENKLAEGQTTDSRFCDKKYVIYINMDDPKRKIRINTEYAIHDGIMELNRYYDRGLCDTIEEYKKLDMHDIESQAYGAWMDGAR